jgi:hypothetical protein
MHKSSFRYFNSSLLIVQEYVNLLKKNKIKRRLRAKPQNRTEVSPTTMECSTIELELPLYVSYIMYNNTSEGD